MRGATYNPLLSQVEDVVKAFRIKFSEEEIKIIEYTADSAGVDIKGS